MSHLTLGRSRAQISQHFVDNKVYILLVGHAVQQIKRLALESVIWIFKTVHHDILILQGVFGIDADYEGKSVDSYVA